MNRRSLNTTIRSPSILTQDILSKTADQVHVQQSRWQIAIMTKCIKNQQAKKHLFAPDQKLAKKRSIENNLSGNGFLTLKKKNGCTITSNDTLKMFHIPINKSLLTLTQSTQTLEIATYP